MFMFSLDKEGTAHQSFSVRAKRGREPADVQRRPMRKNGIAPHDGGAGRLDLCGNCLTPGFHLPCRGMLDRSVRYGNDQLGASGQ
jgi:hypothetical protein